MAFVPAGQHGQDVEQLAIGTDAHAGIDAGLVADADGGLDDGQVGIRLDGSETRRKTDIGPDDGDGAPGFKRLAEGILGGAALLDGGAGLELAGGDHQATS